MVGMSLFPVRGTWAEAVAAGENAMGTFMETIANGASNEQECHPAHASWAEM